MSVSPEEHIIYLDHAATTPMLPEARDAMICWMGRNVGNPSSLHSAGREARKAVADARDSVASLIGATSCKEVIFTSGGTESDNMAILGMIPYMKSNGKDTVLVSSVEHHAILNLRDTLEKSGIEMKYIPVNHECVVDLEVLREKLETNRVGLVSVMLANNEVGTIQDLSAISELAHKYGAFVHTDAVQAVGHMNVDVQTLNVDMLSLSGHKIGASDGVGALYVKLDLQKYLQPLINGGGQEFGMRAGTENVAAIVGLGVVANQIKRNINHNLLHYNSLRDAFLQALYELSALTQENACYANHLPNIVSLSIPGVMAESILLLMDADNVCLSAGSACSAGNLEPSHVLTAMGMTTEQAVGTIRVSFGLTNTKEEVVRAAELLVKNIERIQSMYNEGKKVDES